MILLSIEDTDYRLRHEWEDLTLRDAMALYAIPPPDKFRELLELLAAKKHEEYTAAYNAMTPVERIKTLPVYYGQVIQAASNIPGEVINRLQWRLRTDMFEKYLLPVIAGLYYSPVWERLNIREFTLGGTVFVLPDDDRMDAVEFCEAADIEAFGTEIYGGRWEKMPMLMAVLCRPEGEPYNEATVRARYELFKDCPLSVVWEVYFFLSDYLTVLKNVTQTYLQNLTSKRQRQAIFQG